MSGAGGVPGLYSQVHVLWRPQEAKPDEQPVFQPGRCARWVMGLFSPGSTWVPAPDLPAYFYNGAHATLGDKAFLMGGTAEVTN